MVPLKEKYEKVSLHECGGTCNFDRKVTMFIESFKKLVDILWHVASLIRAKADSLCTQQVKCLYHWTLFNYERVVEQNSVI